MSALLRSTGILRSLKSLAETAVCLRALKPYSANIASKNFHIHNARFFAVQHKSLRTERDTYNNERSNVLERLNTEGRQFGRISFNLFQEAVSQLQHKNNVSSSHGLVVLRCCGALMPEELPEARTALAHKIWEILERNDLSLDLSHYNALLRAYIENEHDFAPAEFLDRLKAKNIEPNRVTYHRLITRYAQLGDIEGATKILEVMKDLNLPINENIFHSLILGHSRAGDLKSAEDMLAVMQESGLEPSVDTYLALAIAQAEQGDINGLKSTIALSAEKEAALHDRDLMEVIYGLASKGHFDHVPEIIKLLKAEWGYNEDCKNLIFRLLNAGCDDTARLMYNTMDSLPSARPASRLNKGLFYVKHLITRDKPLSSILSLCEYVSEDNVHLLQRSLEAAFTRNPKLVYPLMDAIQEKGASLRPHFFWPMIVRCSKTDDHDGVYEVLKNMKARGVAVSMLTMLDFALPALLRNPSTDTKDVVDKLVKVGVTISDASNAMARFYITKGDLPAAVQLLQQYRFKLAPNVRREIAITTVHTKDYWNAAALLSGVRVGRQPDLQPQEDAADPQPDAGGAVTQDAEDVVGRFLLDISQRAGSGAEDFNWVALLRALKDRGLSISKELEATIIHSLGFKATPEVNKLLSSLASGTLRKVQLDRSQQFSSRSKMSVEELEAAVEKCTASGRDPQQLLCNLLLAYCDANEVDKANSVLKTLEETHEYPVGVGLRVIMINMYYGVNQPQPAFDMLEKIRELEPDFLPSSKTILRLAALYVHAGRIEDAVVFLETEAKKRHASEEENSDPGSNDHFTDWLVNRIMLPSAEAGDVDTVSRLERAILDGKFAAPSRRLFNPLVRAYLAKGDLESAWASLVECKNNHSIIPYRKAMAMELIQREDTNKLQQLVDMTTDLYGEHTSLFDLACYFVDAGRVKEAKRVLETPGLRVRSEHLSRVCQYYVRNKQTKSIEVLLAASADVTTIDRRFIYQYLLEAYINEGDCDKALGLWTQMQEEDLSMPDKFLHDLGTFLQQNDKPVPFAIPENVVKNLPRAMAWRWQGDQQSQKNAEFEQPTHPKLLEFRNLLADEKLDEALSLHNEMLATNDKILDVRDSRAIADKLFHTGRLHDALQVCQASSLLQKRRSTGFALGRKISSRLAELGDYDSIESLLAGSQNKEKKHLHFCLCKAAAASNQVERYFNKSEEAIDQASSPEQLKLITLTFPLSGFLMLVKKDASLLTKLENLSDKMKSKGLMHGLKTLWAYHFTEGNKQEMEKLSEELKKNGTTIAFAPVLHHCRESQDLAVAENLLSYLQVDPPSKSDTGVAATYSCMIDILCAKNSPREALKTLEESLKSVELKAMNVGTLKTLSEQLAAENIKFPYEIPSDRKVQTETVSF